jgi:hypothetical protein
MASSPSRGSAALPTGAPGKDVRAKDESEAVSLTPSASALTLREEPHVLSASDESSNDADEECTKQLEDTAAEEGLDLFWDAFGDAALKPATVVVNDVEEGALDFFLDPFGDEAPRQHAGWTWELDGVTEISKDTDGVWPDAATLSKWTDELLVKGIGQVSTERIGPVGPARRL